MNKITTRDLSVLIAMTLVVFIWNHAIAEIAIYLVGITIGILLVRDY